MEGGVLAARTGLELTMEDCEKPYVCDRCWRTMPRWRLRATSSQFPLGLPAERVFLKDYGGKTILVREKKRVLCWMCAMDYRDKMDAWFGRSCDDRKMR